MHTKLPAFVCSFVCCQYAPLFDPDPSSGAGPMPAVAQAAPAATPPSTAIEGQRQPPMSARPE